MTAMMILSRVSRICFLFLFFFFCFTYPCSCQSSSPHNTQTLYPFISTPVIPPTPITHSSQPPPPPPPPSLSPPPKKAILIAVGATAASTLVVTGAVFFLCCKSCVNTRSQRGGGAVGTTTVATSAEPEFARLDFNGSIKGLIVNENGVDVLYWKRQIRGTTRQGSFHREAFDHGNNGRRPFARGRSSTSYGQVLPEFAEDEITATRTSDGDHQLSQSSHPAAAEAAPRPSPGDAVSTINEECHSPSAAPSRSSSPPARCSMPPPPPPPPLRTRVPVPELEKGEHGTADDQVKSKKGSTTSNKIENGSFQYNGDMLEALFGHVATNHRSPKQTSSIGNREAGCSRQSAETSFILDQTRSHEIAILLRSLTPPINIATLVDGLVQGTGLDSDTLEKLSRISLAEEDASRILAFEGDLEMLTDTESFLCRLLRDVPSAFSRVNAMLFRVNYNYQITQFKESLQTIESACNELKSNAVFLRLLEAILKTGNRLNAGNSKGNAKAFDVTALLKLSNYKSSDGKTTLLHFVLHQLVRNEGKQQIMARNNRLTHSSSGDGNTTTSRGPKLEDSMLKEESERELIQLGLPVVARLSADQFSNVMKAAEINYDTLLSTIESMSSHLLEVQQLVMQCGTDEGGFIKGMKDFLKAAEGEVKDVKEEKARVMDAARRTIQNYRSAASKERHSLQLFVIARDFLAMVDQVCSEISRGLQKRKAGTTEDAASSSPDVLRPQVTFPRLPHNFLSDNSSRG